MNKEISKTKIEKRLRQKTNSNIIKAIIKLKKTNPEIAKIIAGPVRKQKSINLNELEEKNEGERMLFPGKILSSGNLNKKIEIVGISFSEKAKEKISNSGGNISLLFDELEKNPELKNIKLIEK